MLKLLLTATTAAALALPAAAGASTASIEEGAVVWRGDASAETVYVDVSYDDLTKVRITGAGVEAGSGCSPYHEPSNGDRGAVCPNRPTWRLEAGAGDDKLVTLMNPTPESRADAVQVDLGPGNDVFETSLSVATVHGGDGDDRLESSVYAGTQNYDDRFFGDAGDDELLGGYGSDELRGGPGNDVLLGDGRSISRRPDVLDGGAGRDKLADYVPIAPYTGKAASVSLDELANDGFPNEGDDVRAVEIVHSYAALDFLGSDAPEEALFAYQNENIDPSGPSTLRGRGGDDALTGTLRADTLDGGAGRDVLDGAAGDDTLAARDGEIDTLRCGAGTDKAVVDAEDQVAADCETVERPAPPAPPAPAPAPPAPAPVPVTPITVPGPAPAPAGPVQQAGTDAPAAPRVIGAPRLKAALSSGLRLRVAGRPGTRVAVRALRGRQALATGSGTVAASGTATITLRFSAKGRKALRGARSLTLSLLVEGGGTAKVTLRR